MADNDENFQKFFPYIRKLSKGITECRVYQFRKFTKALDPELPSAVDEDFTGVKGKSILPYILKDAPPAETIKKAKTIIEGIRLELKEAWFNPVEGLPSVRLYLEDTTFGVNGKGATKELALASAYGELIERLFNKTLFRYGIPFHLFWENERGHYFSKDETLLSYGDLILDNADFLAQLFGKQYRQILSKSTYQKLCKLSSPERTSTISLPFSEMGTGINTNIPLQLLDFFYGSNGMVCGNTREEALVQGISEVFERYAMKQLLLKPLKMAEISDAHIKKTHLWEAYQKVKANSTNYDFRLLDLSESIRLPVFAALLIDKKTGKILFNPASHPVFDIALERALTEIFQGISKIEGLCDVSTNTSVVSYEENIKSILAKRRGYYPSWILKHDLTPKLTPSKYFYSGVFENKPILNFIETLVKFFNWRVFIRTIASPGFHVYHIIIPGISEISSPEKKSFKRNVDFFLERKTVRDNLRNLNNIDKKQRKKIYCFFKKHIALLKEDLVNFARAPLKNSSPLYKIPVAYIGLILAVEQEDFVFAERCLAICQGCIKQPRFQNLFMVIRKHISLCLSSGNNKKKTLEILKDLFGNNAVLAALDMLSVDKLKGLDIGKCPACKNCTHIPSCVIPAVKRIEAAVDNLVAVDA